jgi:hypothetical protein
MDKKTWGGNHAIQILLYNCVQSNKLPFGELLHFVVDSKNAVSPDRHANVSLFQIAELIDCVTQQYSVRIHVERFSDVCAGSLTNLVGL